MIIGCGMIARGEVALAVYAAGASLIYYGPDGTLLGLDPLVPTILLVVLTSVICPLTLKIFYRDDDKNVPQLPKDTFVDLTSKEGGYIP